VQSTSTSWTLAANTTLSGNTQLTIQVPRTVASDRRGNGVERLAPLTLALLLLPFAGRVRRAGHRMGRMLGVAVLLLVSMAAMVGMTGCGASGGFFTQSQQSYPVTVTVSSGTLSQNTMLTLTVQ